MPNAKFNKEIIKHNFSRAADKYNDLASVQNYTAKNLVELSRNLIKADDKIIDLGCGTGFVKKYLLQHGSNNIFECDISLSMLKKSCDPSSKNHKVCCDFNNLPFAKHSFDIVISSFSLQWLDDFDLFLPQIHTLLKDEGKLIFAIPNSESFEELKRLNLFTLNELPKNDLIKQMLEKHGFKELLFSQEVLIQEFPDPFKAVKFIKNIGANYSPKSITSEKLVSTLRSFYLKNCGDKNKNFRLSWKISFFCLKKNKL